jgi:hypothetical protein
MISKRILSLGLSVLACAAAPLSATTLSGSVTYAGQPITSVFSDLSYGRAAAVSSETSEWRFGTADPLTGTYQIPDLSQGRWSVRVFFGPNDIGDRVLPQPGEVAYWQSTDIPAGATVNLDLEAKYAYRFTQPYGDVWPGSVSSCPPGGSLPAAVTFAWEPVPLATRYLLRVTHLDCAGSLESTLIDTQETSAQVLQGTVAGEEYLAVTLQAYSAGGDQLAISSSITYDSGSAGAAFVHLMDGQRTAHPPSSIFIPQVARLQGVGSSFWTSDLVLTNPTSSAVTATLSFTPRGASGLTDYLGETVSVPAGGCRVLEDVVQTVFNTSGAGSLEISPATLGVSSRISTPGRSGGSYGQGFPGASTNDGASLAGPVTTLGAGGVARGPARSNLALTEVWGESVGFEVVVLDREGAALGSVTRSLPPFGNTQLNDVVGLVGGPTTLAEGRVTVTVTSGGGRVVAALSLVDQITQDPTTLVLEPR